MHAGVEVALLVLSRCQRDIQLRVVGLKQTILVLALTRSHKCRKVYRESAPLVVSHLISLMACVHLLDSILHRSNSLLLLPTII